MKIIKAMISDARNSMILDFEARLDAAARRFRARTRAQEFARSPEGRAKVRRGRRETLAVLVGDAYHENIKALYVSKSAAVMYGKGGCEAREYPYGGRYKTYAAVWHNAGARWEGRSVVLENSKGVEVARVRVPLDACFSGLIHGDLYALRTDTGVDRYGVEGKTGVAIPAGFAGWEHGATVEECYAEIERKRQIARDRDEIARLGKRDMRRLRLLARISKQVMVSRDDAAASGSCRAGIDAWCKRVGVESDRLPAADVYRLAIESNERRAIAAAIVACRRAVQ
jgi:hypothetical protein